MYSPLGMATARPSIMMKFLIAAIACCMLLPSITAKADGLTVEPTARYRFQQVNDPIRGDAQASTLKVRLSAVWKAQSPISAFVQADYVEAFNENGFNSVTVTRNASPIPDPPGGELNQAWLQYTGESNWYLRAGRQWLKFDNERHVGTIEFWQNDQTFDALSLVYNDSLNWDISLVHIERAHRIFGDDAKARLPEDDIRFEVNPNRPVFELGNHDHNSNIINARYSADRRLAVTAYAYLLENESAQRLSTNTFGARLSGEFKPEAIKYAYTVEFAKQKDSGDNPWQLDANYTLVELSAQYKSHQLMISHERLGESNGFGFATSLGTNHKFLGWADVFTNYISTGGIRDTFVTYRGRAAKLRWRIVAHQFRDDGSGDIAGNELDLELGYRFNRQWEGKLIAAKYFAKNGIPTLPASQQNLSTWSLSLAYNF